jgi:hypothetical protein
MEEFTLEEKYDGRKKVNRSMEIESMSNQCGRDYNTDREEPQYSIQSEQRNWFKLNDLRILWELN